MDNSTSSVDGMGSSQVSSIFDGHDHRHAIMEGLHQGVAVRGEDRATIESLALPCCGAIHMPVDVNNFYVSCERVFNPHLENRPVVVLSNNDGCAVTRSNESKEIGVEMGAPWFQLKELAQKHNIIALSSNYTLYGDMSDRVMSILREYSPNVEPYSIDELSQPERPG